MGRDPKETPSKGQRTTPEFSEEQRRARRSNRGNGAVADWSSCDGSKLRNALSNVTNHGFALMLGYTRDKGSYTVRVVGTADEDVDYVRATEDIDYYLECLAMDYE